MHILLNTGPLVALLNRRDTFHIWSVEKARNLFPPFYTCEAILAEAHFLLVGINQGNRRLIDLLSSGKIVCTPVASRDLNRVGELMMTYANVRCHSPTHAWSAWGRIKSVQYSRWTVISGFIGKIEKKCYSCCCRKS